MRRSRSALLLAAAVASLPLIAACGNATGPQGDPNGDLTVEFRNFRPAAWVMGLVGGSPTSVVGNVDDGNPPTYQVVSPGLGGSLDFFAASAGDTLTATCTVTSATGVSEPPGVVVQPGFDVLDCVSW